MKRMMDLMMKLLSTLIMVSVCCTGPSFGWPVDGPSSNQVMVGDGLALKAGATANGETDLPNQPPEDSDSDAHTAGTSTNDKPSIAVSSAAFISAAVQACDESEGDVPASATSDESAADEETPTATAVERWVIGIRCEEAPYLLRSHLKLGEAGVVILSVHPETPAAKADLKVGDIIVQMDEDQLTCRNDLTERVQAFDGEPLELAIIREGDRRMVKITPQKMMVEVLVAPATSENPEPAKNDVDADGRSNLRNVYPGVLFEGSSPYLQEDGADLQQNVEKILHQLRVMAKQQSSENDGASGRIIIDMDAAQDGPPSPQSESELLTKMIAALHEQMANIQKQINDLNKRLQAVKTEAKDPQKKEAP